MKKLCMNLEALKIPTKDSSLDQCWYSSSDSDFQIPWIEGHTHVEDYFLIWCQITVFYWIINSFKLDVCWPLWFTPVPQHSYTSMLLSVCSYIFQHVGQWIVYHPQRGPWTPAPSPQPTAIPLGKLLDPILSHGKPVPLDMFLLVLATQLSFSPYSES